MFDNCSIEYNDIAFAVMYIDCSNVEEFLNTLLIGGGQKINIAIEADGFATVYSSKYPMPVAKIFNLSKEDIDYLLKRFR